jgi:hypothetical protein
MDNGQELINPAARSLRSPQGLRRGIIASTLVLAVALALILLLNGSIAMVER